MSAGAFAFEEGLDRKTRATSSHPWTTVEIVAAAANAAIAIAIVFAFYDRFWWAPDEGTYAYIADRLLHGAVLNGDVRDFHGGYVHFLHAFALDLFGRDFVSLRYPLAFLTVVQSCIVFALLRPAIGAASLAGGLAMAALTFVQFINPTANWYALFLTVVLIALLAARADRNAVGLATIGFFLAMIFLFRQLSGVFVGMGTIAWLFVWQDGSGSDRTDRPAVARAVAAISAVGLAVYLWSKGDAASFFLYGIMPLAVLIAVAFRTRMANRRALATVATLAVGGAVAVLPLFLYHLWHGSLAGWWRDSVVSALSLTDLDFFARSTYLRPLVLALGGIFTTTDPVIMFNGTFWLIVLLSPLALGAMVLCSLRSAGPAIHPLPFIAVFYSLVSFHYAIPIYALFSMGLVLTGILAMFRAPAWRWTAAGLTVFAVAVGLTYQAAQPLTRGLAGVVHGTRVALDADGIPGASVRMERRDQATYLDLLGFIESHSGPRDTILGLPMTAELYFLSARNPPVTFAIAPLGLLTDRDFEESWHRLEAHMPAVVVFKPADKYVTARVRDLMERLRPHYRKCETLGGFELYAPVCHP